MTKAEFLLYLDGVKSRLVRRQEYEIAARVRQIEKDLRSELLDLLGAQSQLFNLELDIDELASALDTDKIIDVLPEDFSDDLAKSFDELRSTLINKKLADSMLEEAKAKFFDLAKAEFAQRADSVFTKGCWTMTAVVNDSAKEHEVEKLCIKHAQAE